MSTRRRVILMLLSAFAFGVLAASIKGAGGADSAAEIRSAVGNLSAPWLLVAFVAGAAFSRLRSGALAGLAATLIALTGFYLVNAVLHDNGPGLVGDMRFELSANRGYLQGGVVAGLLFGALGAWWRQRQTLGASVLAGALLMVEPLVLIVIGAFGPGGVLSPDGLMPTVVRIVPGWQLTADSPTVSIAVYAAEFAVGVALVLLAVLRPRTSARASS